MSGLRFRTSRAAATIAVIALSLMVACKNSNRSAPKTHTQAGTLALPDSTAARRDTAVTATAAKRDSVAPVAGTWINDANALALVGLMSSRQIAAAERELQAWHSDTVRAFAEASLRDHRAIQHSVDSVAAVTRIAPVTPALAESIGAAMQAQLDSIQGGRMLDRSFVQQQIAGNELMASYADQLAAVSERPEVQGVMAMAALRARAQRDRARAVEASFAMADSIAADSAAKASLRKKRSDR